MVLFTTALEVYDPNTRNPQTIGSGDGGAGAGAGRPVRPGPRAARQLLPETLLQFGPEPVQQAVRLPVPQQQTGALCPQGRHGPAEKTPSREHPSARAQ